MVMANCLGTLNRTPITEMTVPQIYTVLIPIEFCMAYFIAILTGATIFPVCPTCKSLGTKPASTAAREAPTKEKNICHFFKLYYSTSCNIH